MPDTPEAGTGDVHPQTSTPLEEDSQDLDIEDKSVPKWLKAREVLRKNSHVTSISKELSTRPTEAEKKTKQHLEKLQEEGVETVSDFLHKLHEGGSKVAAYSGALLSANDSDRIRSKLKEKTYQEGDNFKAFRLLRNKLTENSDLPEDLSSFLDEFAVAERHSLHLAAEISTADLENRNEELRKELDNLNTRRSRLYEKIVLHEESLGSSIEDLLIQRETEEEQNPFIARNEEEEKVIGNLSKTEERIKEREKNKKTRSSDVGKYDNALVRVRTVLDERGKSRQPSERDKKAFSELHKKRLEVYREYDEAKRVEDWNKALSKLKETKGHYKKMFGILDGGKGIFEHEEPQPGSTGEPKGQVEPQTRQEGEGISAAEEDEKEPPDWKDLSKEDHERAQQLKRRKPEWKIVEEKPPDDELVGPEELPGERKEISGYKFYKIRAMNGDEFFGLVWWTEGGDVYVDYTNQHAVRVEEKIRKDIGTIYPKAGSEDIEEQIKDKLEKYNFALTQLYVQKEKKIESGGEPQAPETPSPLGPKIPSWVGEGSEPVQPKSEPEPFVPSPPESQTEASQVLVDSEGESKVQTLGFSQSEPEPVEPEPITQQQKSVQQKPKKKPVETAPSESQPELIRPEDLPKAVQPEPKTPESTELELTDENAIEVIARELRSKGELAGTLDESGVKKIFENIIRGRIGEVDGIENISVGEIKLENNTAKVTTTINVRKEIRGRGVSGSIELNIRLGNSPSDNTELAKEDLSVKPHGRGVGTIVRTLRVKKQINEALKSPSDSLAKGLNSELEDKNARVDEISLQFEDDKLHFSAKGGESK